MLNRILNLYNRMKRKFSYIKNNHSFYINNFITNIFYGNLSLRYHKFETSKEDIEEGKESEVVEKDGYMVTFFI